MERINTELMTSSVGLVFQHKHLDFLQNNTAKQDINNVYSVYGSEYTGALVLWGCVPTFTNANNTLTITKGAVSYNGEVYEVLAGASTKTGGNVHLLSLPVITPDASDPSLLTNGTSIDVQDIRRIEVSQGLTGTGSCDWVNIERNNPYGASLTHNGTGYARYRKEGRRVTIECQLSAITGGGDTLFILPLSIRPSSDIQFPALIIPLINTQYIEIQSGGGAVVSNAPTGAFFTVVYYLD